MKKTIKISIRNLVEFIMRHGSIDNRYQGATKAIEGIRGHQKIQNTYGENDLKEVPLKHKITYENLEIEVEGRADGILKEGQRTIIDEIKTTTKDLLLIDEDTNPLHFAQAKCYGYIYSIQNDIKEIDIQITYYNIETKTTRILRNTYTIHQLEEFFFWLVDEYKYWAELQNSWINIRNKSIKSLKFPFENYRQGQRELAIRVYKSITDNRNCFVQAPTGTGKTISTLFPTIKAMGEEHTSKIFYLTAKTITREVAQNTISLMRKQDLDIKAVTITAKEKICKMDKVDCNPDYCPYAKGYFDRINNSLKDILNKYNDYSRENIDKISEEYKLCPFELSLDLTLLSDVIICDYNYVFDPKVSLKRFFDVKKTDYTFLIDEAHNLVDRAREMYSTTLEEDKFLKVKKSINKKEKRLIKVIEEVENYFKDKYETLNILNEENLVEKEPPLEFCDILSSFLKFSDEYLSRNHEENEELKELYFDVHSFLSISDLYDKNYTTIYKSEFSSINIKLYCVNPSNVIIDKIKKAKSTTIFSATLIPMDYFLKMYGYSEEDFVVSLKSPFDTNNRLLMIGDNIATTYTRRNETSDEITDYIANCIKSKKGNYMVFFPSYKYMELVFDKIKINYPDINVSIQESNMSEKDKEIFINSFEEDNDIPHVAFCVLGGHFSEGIDLTYDKLIGVIIVGVGMPQIGIDRDIIKDMMNEDNKGFEYAYVYPGMIKVLQAAGRCIRTDKDKGVILLLDNRYSHKRYQSLFPYEWYPNIRVKNSDYISEYCKEFWSNN